MPDINTGPIELPVGDKVLKFGRIRPYMLFSAIDWLNQRVVSTTLEAMRDEPANDRADMIRRVARTYTSDDMGKLLNDQDYQLHVLFLAYLRENPSATKEEFVNLFEFADVAQVEAFIDVLAGYDQREIDSPPPDAANPPTEMTAPAGSPSSP